MKYTEMESRAVFLYQQQETTKGTDMLKITTSEIKELLQNYNALFDEVADSLYEQLGGAYEQTREGEYIEVGPVTIGEVGQALQEWLDHE